MFKSLALRTKLFIVIGVPMLVIGGIAAVAFLQAKTSADDAADQVRNVEQALAIEQLAAIMRSELGATIDSAETRDSLAQARAETDTAMNEVLGFLNEADRAELEITRSQLSQLRESLGSDPGAAWNLLSLEVLGRAPEVPRTLWGTQTFQRLITSTVELDRLRGDVYPDGETALDIALLKNMALWEDALVSERNAFNLYLQPGVTDVAEQKGLLGPNASASQMQSQFVSLAPDSRADVVQRLTQGTALLSLERARVITRSGSSSARGELDIQQVVGSIDAVLAAITSEQVLLESQIVGSANRIAADARDQQRNVLLGGLGLLAAVSLITLALSRSITGPLKSLTRRSRQIATEDLPEAVALFRSKGADADAIAIEPLVADSKDELGELVEAFNELHTTAIGLAAEQAQSRRVASEMFVNLGHRNQRLLSRALKDMDELEREEQNPSRLAKLFSVDQKITRMRRNAESLLVLAGTRTPRQWSQPAPIADVIRAAMAEVEDFERVDVKATQNIPIKGAVVADLTHLLAELIENALRFSPPNTRVEVGTRVTNTESLVYVLDNGFGLSDEDREAANNRISDAAVNEETPSKRLGHYVVGRLGSRHGIDVQLREESVTGGTVARVVLGAAVEGTADAQPEPKLGEDLASVSTPAIQAPMPAQLSASTNSSASDSLSIDPAAPLPAEPERFMPEPATVHPEPVAVRPEPVAAMRPEPVDVRPEPVATTDGVPATLAEALPPDAFNDVRSPVAPVRRVPGQHFGVDPAVQSVPVDSGQQAHVQKMEELRRDLPVTQPARAAVNAAPTADASPTQPPVASSAPSPQAPRQEAAPGRRVPGANIPAALRAQAGTPSAQLPSANPAVTRDAFSGFQKSAQSDTPPLPERPVVAEPKYPTPAPETNRRPDRMDVPAPAHFSAPGQDLPGAIYRPPTTKEPSQAAGDRRPSVREAFDEFRTTERNSNHVPSPTGDPS